MTQLNDQLIREMVEQVLQHVQTGWGGRVVPTPGRQAPPPVSRPASGAQQFGQFATVDEAVAAAKVAQQAICRRSLAQREIACDLMREICKNRADDLGNMEFEETKIGIREHKIAKLINVHRSAVGTKGLSTTCFSGDYGITLQEAGPWGVIGSITPVTHSLPTLAFNAINMIAAGNAMVCCPHPGGKRIAAYGAKLFNQAIYEKLGIDNLVCVVTEPTLETAQQLFKHPDVQLLVITGGPGVVADALKSGKRAICAGPGNPPVVVDASADLQNAADCIIEGCYWDNNLLCLGEKEAFVEAPVFDAFMTCMERAGAYRLTPQQMDQLAATVINPAKPGDIPHANKKYVGVDASVLAGVLGINVPAGCKMLFGQVHSNMHPLVQAEQMMPVLPVMKCDTFEQAVDFAKQAEHGFRHTSVLHSKLVDHMTYMGKIMDTTLFVKNGPSVAGNGGGGEGYGNHTIACTTGEGIATPMLFTRFRRCVMVDNLRIV